MASEFVKASVQDGILWVSIERAAKRNALSLAVLGEIGRTFTDYAHDSDLIAAVITAAGERCFAAGGDLDELDRVRDLETLTTVSGKSYAALESVRRFPVPVIAALNGDAIGGGAEFAVACDMRVFARHARIAFVQGTLSVSSAWGGGADLMRLVGPASALRLLTRADFVAADEALQLGLAQAVAGPDETIHDALENFLAPIRAMRPQVMRAFKALARAHCAGADPAELRRVEFDSLSETWLHADHWAAAAAVQQRISDKKVS